LEDPKQVNKIFSNLLPTVGLSCAFLTITAIASGSTEYNLSVANCSGGGATVAATTIVWSPSGTAPNTGCIDSGIASSVSYMGGTLGAGDVGNIADLTVGDLPVDDFMTFAGTPLDFVLTGVGPGLSNTNCALSTTNTTCSVFAGSPFILTYVSPSVTGVALGVNGTVNVLGGAASWNGSFTTQLNLSGTQIQTEEDTAGGSISSTQSGNFNVTVTPASSTPEPSSMAMQLTGGGLIAIAWRRKRQRP
jgi:hypothetical protein